MPGNLTTAIAKGHDKAGEIHGQKRRHSHLQLGESVGQYMQSEPEFMLVFMGPTAAGCSIVSLSSMWDSKELKFATKDSGCKVIMCDAKRLQQAIAIFEAFAAEPHTTFNLQPGESAGQCMQNEPEFYSSSWEPQPLVAVPFP